MSTRYACSIVLSSLVASAVCVMMVTSATADQLEAPGLRVGWVMTNITPDKPVLLPGFFEKRISTGVRDPLTATVLALETIGPDGKATEQAIMVSCDLCTIRKSNQDSVRKIIKDRIADFDSDKLFLNSTATHQAALGESGVYKGTFRLSPEEKARGVMSGDEYGKFLAQRLADAIVKAWQTRRSGGLARWGGLRYTGLGRRLCRADCQDAHGGP